MATKEINDEVARLRSELNRHNYLYYAEAKPEVSDREYDRMMSRLTELEAAHPELVTSGNTRSASRSKVSRPCGTLSHALDR